MRQIILIFLLLTVGISPAVAANGAVAGITGGQHSWGNSTLPGVLVSTGSNYTYSNFAGAYSLSLPPGNYTISYSKEPEYYTAYKNVTIVSNETVSYNPLLLQKPTGTITGTVTAPCIPSVDGGCYSGYEAPYNLMTIPYYAGEFVDVVTGEYDDVIMFEYHDYKDFAEVPANSVYTFHRGMIGTPLRIYSNSSIAAVHKRSDYHIVINPIQILSQNIHVDVLALNTASLNILQNLGNNAVIEDFGYGGRFNV